MRTMRTCGGILGILWKVMGGGVAGVVSGASGLGVSEGEKERWPSLLCGDGCDGGDGGGSSDGDGGESEVVVSFLVVF